MLQDTNLDDINRRFLVIDIIKQGIRDELLEIKEYGFLIFGQVFD